MAFSLFRETDLFSALQCFLHLIAFHAQKFIYSQHFLISEMIILSIGDADYSYRLQPIILIIGQITRMTVMSVQL